MAKTGQEQPKLYARWMRFDYNTEPVLIFCDGDIPGAFEITLVPEWDANMTLKYKIVPVKDTRENTR